VGRHSRPASWPPSAWRFPSSPAAPEAAVRAIKDCARGFRSLPPDPDLIAAIAEAASGESHALTVRDPAMAETVRHRGA